MPTMPTMPVEPVYMQMACSASMTPCSSKHHRQHHAATARTSGMLLQCCCLQNMFSSALCRGLGAVWPGLLSMLIESRAVVPKRDHQPENLEWQMPREHTGEEDLRFILPNRQLAIVMHIQLNYLLQCIYQSFTTLLLLLIMTNEAEQDTWSVSCSSSSILIA